MKKEYMKPQMEVVRINMSATILVDSKVTGLGGNSGLGLGGGSNGAARGRESDDWDDEW